MALPWKTAWITGASSGIGRSLAMRLARRGVAVAVSARSRDGLESLAQEAGAAAARIVPVPLDVTDRDATQAALVSAIQTLGGLPDLAVLNAGTYEPMAAANFDAARFRVQMEVNLMGTVHALEALLPRYLAARRGHIAIVASVAGYRGLPRAAAYGPTKAALINLAESLKFDLDRAGVKLQLVDPGFVKTPLTDKNDFTMPFLMPVDRAVTAMIAGLRSGRFEINFPRRFTWQMRLLRILPYRLYFAIVRARSGA